MINEQLTHSARGLCQLAENGGTLQRLCGFDLV